MMMLPRREAMCRGVIPFCQEERQSVRRSSPSSFKEARDKQRRGDRESYISAQGQCRGTACLTGLCERAVQLKAADRSYTELAGKHQLMDWAAPMGLEEAS